MDLVEILREFLSLFWNMVVGYATYGWFFAILHLLVGFLIYRSWHDKILLESDALELWVPPHKRALSNPKAGETTRLLDRFVEESKKLGPQGFFVPMTDYSDRLDSIIDGMLAELHDRTNLFILVGIAGTLFGVFEFAFRSHLVALDQSLDPGYRVQKLGEFLSESMSKAFPVGFMGLLLTFVSQIVATIPEKRLRDALSKATREALKCREEDSVSQAGILRDSAKAIREAMEPISGLETTLTHSLQPIVQQFGERLDDSLKLVTLQFNQLQQATTSIHKAVETVQLGVGSLEHAAASLETVLKDAPDVLQGITQIQEHQQSTLNEFDGILRLHLSQAEQINAALDKATEGLIKMPQELMNQTRNALDSVRADSVIAWQDMSNEFGKQIYSDWSNLVAGIGEQAGQIRNVVAALSERLNDVADNAKGAMASLKQVPEGVIAGLEKSFGSLSDQCLQVWTRTSDKFGSDIHGTYVQYLAKISSEAEEVTRSLDSASDSWGRLATNASTFLEDAAKEIVGQARQELESSLRHLDLLLTSRLPEVSLEVQRFTGGLVQLLIQVQGVQREYASWLNNAQTAQATMRDIHRDLLRVRDDIQRGDGRNGGQVSKIAEQLKAANSLLEQIQSRMPTSGNGIHTDLKSSISLLREIRKGIHDMAYKEGVFRRVVKWPWSRAKE